MRYYYKHRERKIFISTNKKSILAAFLLSITIAFPLFANNVHASTTTVKSGDTLWEYSKEYNIPLTDIMKANNISSLDSYMMWPGDKINIPDGKGYTGQFANHFVAPKAVKTSVSTYSNTASTPTYKQPIAQPKQTYSQPANTNKAASVPANNTASTATVKVTFYDPAVLGSNMGYGGVAANLSVYPKGTNLKIVLSDGTVIHRTVNDTGTFAYSNPNQIDIAMPNSSIPPYGTTTASVSVE